MDVAYDWKLSSCAQNLYTVLYIYISTWICCLWEKWDSRNSNKIVILLCKSYYIQELFILCEHDCAQARFLGFTLIICFCTQASFLGFILMICCSSLGTSFCFHPRLVSFLHKFTKYSKWTTPLGHQSTDLPCKLSSFIGDVELHSAWTQPRRQKEVLGVEKIYLDAPVSYNFTNTHRI
jgi:hypothetical protein